MENYKRGLTAGIPIALGYLSVSLLLELWRCHMDYPGGRLCSFR